MIFQQKTPEPKLTPDLTSPIKDNAPDLSPSKPIDREENWFKDMLESLGSDKQSPGPQTSIKFNGEVPEHRTPTEVTSTSGSCKVASKSLLDGFSSKTYGIASINRDDENREEDEEMKEIHSNITASPKHHNFKPIGIFSPNSDHSAKSSYGDNVAKHSSNNKNENIPESKRPVDKSSSSRQSKSKKSQSRNKSNVSSLSAKQDTFTQSPLRKVSVKEDQKSRVSDTSLKTSSGSGGTPKKGRKSFSKHSKTALSQEFLPSSDSSGSDLSNHGDTFAGEVKQKPAKVPRNVQKNKSATQESIVPKSGEHSNNIHKASLDLSRQLKETLRKPNEGMLSHSLCGNSQLDVHNILNDVSIPGALLSPVPSVPNLAKFGKADAKLQLPKLKTQNCNLSPLIKQEIPTDSIAHHSKDLDVPNLMPEVRFVDGMPSLIVSIDLKFLNLPKINNSKDVKENVPSDKSSHRRKSGENIFQNMNNLKREVMKLDLNTEEVHNTDGYATDTNITPDIVPSQLFPPSDECVTVCSNENRHLTAESDSLYNTISASQVCQESIPKAAASGATPTLTDHSRLPHSKDQEAVDVSHAIIELESKPPPLTKIPKKRRKEDCVSRDRNKKARVSDERLYRGVSPSSHRGIESPQYNKRSADHYSRRTNRKRPRIEQPMTHDDECSRSPSMRRESPARWSMHSSDYRRTPQRYDDYSQSDRE